MPHLEVNGATLYYETDGHITSPALLLIHAGIATLRMWDPQIEALAAEHFVIRFDTRGYGQTESENVEFSNLSDALAILDHLGIACVTLIGSSRGGSISIDLAVEHPDRVLGLVTIGSGPTGYPEENLTDNENARFDEIDVRAEAEDWDAVAGLETALWCFGPERSVDDLDPIFVETAYALNADNARHFVEDPTQLPITPPAYDRVADIRVPALIMVGVWDLSVVLAQFEYLTATIPDAIGYRFEGAAHLPNVECPGEFRHVVMRWLALHKL